MEGFGVYDGNNAWFSEILEGYDWEWGESLSKYNSSSLKSLPPGTAATAAMVLAFLAFLAAKKSNLSPIPLLAVSSFSNRDHQLKSSQPELDPHSAGDSDA